MKVCTFFGHRMCPPEIEPCLRQAIISLIERDGVGLFLVGEEGGFDAMARRVLAALAEEYAIDYAVVPAYLPTEPVDAAHTMMPPDFERYPKRFAIDYRNRYLLQRADYVIAYMTTTVGGAAKFVKMAQARNKVVINIEKPPGVG